MTKPLEAPFCFSGVIDYDGECQQVSDGEAQFWTVYERGSDGLSSAICDCYHRDDAVAATERFNALIAALEHSRSQSSKWLEAYHKAVSIGAKYEERIAGLEASQLAVKLPGEFAVIGENLRTQDNRITSDPMFCIYQKEEIVVDAEYNHDRIVWWHSDGYEASANQARRLELLSDGLRDTGEWRRLAIKEINDFVTCCFTEQGCKDYLAINGHNLRQPFIYVKSGFRNNEYQTIRNWLMSAGGTVQGDE